MGPSLMDKFHIILRNKFNSKQVEDLEEGYVSLPRIPLLCRRERRSSS